MFKTSIKYNGKFVNALVHRDVKLEQQIIMASAIADLKRLVERQTQERAQSSRSEKNLPPLLAGMKVSRYPLTPGSLLTQGIASGRQRKVCLSLLAPWLEEGKLDAVIKFLLCLTGQINPRRWRRR